MVKGIALRATQRIQILTPITAVGVDLVMPILVGTSLHPQDLLLPDQ